MPNTPLRQQREKDGEFARPRADVEHALGLCFHQPRGGQLRALEGGPIRLRLLAWPLGEQLVEELVRNVLSFGEKARDLLGNASGDVRHQVCDFNDHIWVTEELRGRTLMLRKGSMSVSVSVGD